MIIGRLTSRAHVPVQSAKCLYQKNILVYGTQNLLDVALAEVLGTKLQKILIIKFSLHEALCYLNEVFLKN